MPFVNRIAATALLAGALGAAAQTPSQTPAQAPDLPSAPAPSAPAPHSIFTVPSGTSQIVAASSSAPPPAPNTPEVCYAAAEGIYAPQPELEPKLRQSLERYNVTTFQRVNVVWTRNMPRAANDPWVKRALVTVRFAIFPDGSIDQPLITASSGRKSYDQHALDAIRGASPFPPLPQGATRPLVMCVKFGYNVDPAEFQPKPPDPFNPKPPAAP